MESTKQKIISKGSEFAETTSREIESNTDKEEPLESKEERKDGGSLYPFRLLKPDCAFYVRTGYCRYGGACRFNHPLREMGDSWSASRPRQVNTEEHPKSRVQINLPLSSSSSSSKDNVRHIAHAKATTKSGNAINQQANTDEYPIRTPIVAVSPIGLPLRPDQPVCMFYSRYGLCKDGIGCQHDHPVGYGTAVAQSSNQTPASRDTGNNANK